MKKQSSSRSAFFNPCVLMDFALCSIGLLLALVGLSKSVTGNPVSKTGMSAQATNPVPLINQPLVPDAIAPGGAEIHPDGEWHGLRLRVGGELER